MVTIDFSTLTDLDMWHISIIEDHPEMAHHLDGEFEYIPLVSHATIQRWIQSGYSGLQVSGEIPEYLDDILDQVLERAVYYALIDGRVRISVGHVHRSLFDIIGDQDYDKD